MAFFVRGEAVAKMLPPAVQALGCVGCGLPGRDGNGGMDADLHAGYAAAITCVCYVILPVHTVCCLAGEFSVGGAGSARAALFNLQTELTGGVAVDVIQYRRIGLYRKAARLR